MIKNLKMYIDSHCHIDTIDLAPAHQGCMDTLMAEIKEAKVSHMLCVCIELEALPNILALVNRYDDISYSVGIHPNTVVEKEPSDEELLTLAQKDKCIAIGETGLDYYRNEGDMTWQRERFEQHIRVSNQLKKPLIVHTRQAAKDTINVLKSNQAEQAIMHCFAEDWDIAKQCLDLGYYISLSGIVTFKNAHQVHEVAKKVPLDRLLIETDSPYLAPMPYRGKQNRPSLVPYVCQHIAELRGMPNEALAEMTTNNFWQLFQAKEFFSE